MFVITPSPMSYLCSEVKTMSFTKKNAFTLW